MNVNFNMLLGLLLMWLLQITPLGQPITPEYVLDGDDSGLLSAQRDAQRKNDSSMIAHGVVAYLSNNRGILPTLDELTRLYVDVDHLDLIQSIDDKGDPTLDRAIYTAGSDCDGREANRYYSVSILLESGSVYCTD